ncbi:MAG: methyltransferase domain-containing protein [Chloroflexi bacterium]|nr:methyltransferase domain-containing protein [Chloroflexota bacterium]
MAFTFFFRDTQTLELVAQYALPSLKQNRYIRVWDAGCAMGPEPYSIAIIFRENMGHFLFRNVQIHATDIDESNFESIIQRGVYSEQELGRIPRDIFGKYFAPDGAPGYFQISDELRQAVRFYRHDLLSLQPIREDFGLIVCKNVLLHFKAEQRVQVIQMFHRALVEGGYLVMEQTQKLPSELSPLFRQVTEAAQLYQKVG